MKKKHEKFFHEASLCCFKSEHSKFQHGSVLVYRNSIIGRGSNTGKLHAEVASIKNKRSKRKDRSKLLVFVVRLNVAGAYKMSKPCPRCQEYMRKTGVDEVFYSTDNGFEKMRLD